MKKIMMVLLLLFALIGCSSTNQTKVLIPEGIPSIALGGIFDNHEFSVSVVTGADLITSELVQNNYDVIVAPITAGAKLYLDQHSSYQLAAILTFGNTFLFARENASLSSIYDLEGKTIAAYGQNNTPDIVLKHALQLHEVNATIVYEVSVNDILSNRLLLDESIDYFLLAEPILTRVQETLHILGTVLDLQELLYSSATAIPQAGVFVKAGAPNITVILETLESNVHQLHEDTNAYVDQLLTLDIHKYPFFSRLGKEVIVKSIPNSAIAFVYIKDGRDIVEDFFRLLNTYNPNILGERLPNEDFYYG